MIVAGLDYSYTSPAICIYDTDDDLIFKNLKFYNLFSIKKLQGVYGNVRIDSYPPYENDEDRFIKICDWSSNILKNHNVTRAILEGYALGAKHGRVFQIAENTALLKNYMYTNHIRYDTPSPTQIKKVFTGKGNAKKETIIDQFIINLETDIAKLIGLSDSEKYRKPIDDICDSFAIMMMHRDPLYK